MNKYSFGDVILINFPFAERTGAKRRPSMIIKDTNDGDLLIAKITTKIYNTSFDCIINEWQFTNLVNESVIRLHKIQTISSNLILGKIGELHPSDKKSARHLLAQLILQL